jgi:hypothetical protein
MKAEWENILTGTVFNLYYFVAQFQYCYEIRLHPSTFCLQWIVFKNNVLNVASIYMAFTAKAANYAIEQMKKGNLYFFALLSGKKIRIQLKPFF